jgi:hypothetical protein
MEEVDNIDENDTLLNVIGYFNVDHELVRWMWMLMNILFYSLWICFAIRWNFRGVFIGQLS